MLKIYKILFIILIMSSLCSHTLAENITQDNQKSAQLIVQELTRSLNELSHLLQKTKTDADYIKLKSKFVDNFASLAEASYAAQYLLADQEAFKIIPQKNTKELQTALSEFNKCFYNFISNRNISTNSKEAIGTLMNSAFNSNSLDE